MRRQTLVIRITPSNIGPNWKYSRRYWFPKRLTMRHRENTWRWLYWVASFEIEGG